MIRRIPENVQLVFCKDGHAKGHEINRHCFQSKARYTILKYARIFMHLWQIHETISSVLNQFI